MKYIFIFGIMFLLAFSVGVYSTEIPTDPTDTCSLDSIALIGDNDTILVGETFVILCQANITCSGSAKPGYMFWRWSNSTLGSTWFIINSTYQEDDTYIDCNGDDCWVLGSVIDGVWYNKTIRAVRESQQSNITVKCQYLSDSTWYPYFNITAGTSPLVILHNPEHEQTVSQDFTINCSASDLSGLNNLSLFHNITGTWALNHTIYAEATPDGTQELILNFNDNTTNRITGQEYNRTVGTGDLYYSNGRFGSAMHFNDTFLLYNTTENNIDVSNPTGFTIMMWVTPHYTYSSTSEFFVADYHNADNNMYLAWASADTDIYFKLEAGGNNYALKTNGLSMLANQTYHIVAVADPFNTYIYVNGQLVVSDDIFGSYTGGLPDVNSKDFYVGGYGSTDCDCDLDDVVFIQDALTKPEIEKYYNKTLSMSIQQEYSEVENGTYIYNCEAYDIGNNYGTNNMNYTFYVSRAFPPIPLQIYYIIEGNNIQIFIWLIENLFALRLD